MKPDSPHEQAHPAPVFCHNCQAPTSGNYCQNCGQETHLHPASAREFLHEFVGHYVALEGKLLGTLGRLLFRPGLLTNEYVAGRRVRFVQPLRLYLTLSVLFFALLKFTHGGTIQFQGDAEPAIAQTAAAAKGGDQPAPAAGAPEHAAPAARQAQASEKIEKSGDFDGDIDDATIARWTAKVPGLSKRWQHFEHLSGAEKSKVFGDSFYHFAPYAIFLMMPIFALYLKLLYLGSGKRYGEHLLFALHSNAFAFIALGAMFLIDHGGVNFLLWLWLLAYLPWAMRRVYLRGRRATAWRWLVLMAVYMVTMGIGLLLSMGAGILTAH
ncbi:DUF3667 domain-containing protein [Rugamonas sp. CCM 8940]|uniref:DUF3667 domain-containing protein n=1 Tax=Rugamonas sp. CCM 8940 TaxID=2765359 RepID=UPI0018F683BF|nr:DUF3667 domain-containing protein [Rugamonas sp. CCM 8940]MBJ7314033.1 DUF3667 domain-containing protein [Rugamonas sp. CCM 8940]